MNKEYKYLSSDKIIVSNEKGKMKERKIESSDIHRELILENNIEESKLLKKYIEKTLKANKEDNSKIKNIMIPILALLESLMLLFIHQFNLYNITAFAIFDYIVFEIAGFGPLTMRKNKKRINALEKELEKINELLDKYEEELSKLKTIEIKETIVTTKQETKQIPSEIISLENYMTLPEETFAELNEAYEEGYRKKLKLK